MRQLVMILALACFLTAAPGRAAYEEATVTDGATISGKVLMTGGKPSSKGFNLITFPDPVYCGRISTGTGWRLLDEFTIAPDGGLKDVVVALVDVPKGKPFAFTPPTIEARDCRFLPFVATVRDGDKVVVVNMDPVMHDIQAYETSHLGPRVLFNTPLPMNPHHRRNVGADTHEHLAGQPMTEEVRMTKGRKVFVMQCGFHAYMESWALAVDNPYYAVTKEDGTYSISEVPPGDYQLVAWHPQAGPVLEQRVTVAAKGSLSVGFEFKAPQGRRSAHEMVENPHYHDEALVKAIRPTLELQRP